MFIPISKCREVLGVAGARVIRRAGLLPNRVVITSSMCRRAGSFQYRDDQFNMYKNNSCTRWYHQRTYNGRNTRLIESQNHYIIHHKLHVIPTLFILSTLLYTIINSLFMHYTQPAPRYIKQLSLYIKISSVGGRFACINTCLRVVNEGYRCPKTFGTLLQVNSFD